MAESRGCGVLIMNGGTGGPYWVSFLGQPEGLLTLKASCGGGVTSAKPPAGLQGTAVQELPGQGALPPPGDRKRGWGMANLTHPSSLLRHSPALGLCRGI